LTEIHQQLMQCSEVTMLKSKATANWTGTFKRGAGTMKPATAAEIPFSAGTRFESQQGSNPEELVGAALAGCFSMALSVGLEQGGATPTAIRTSAEVTLEKRDDGFTITHIHLDTEVEADGIEEDAFQEVAKNTKASCPVSKALAAVESITLDARLRTA
jgi:osmotically inducible protein OsmC